MKKLLALVLALVMTMSLVTISNAADFTDASDIDYKEAVAVMKAVGVIDGYTDGSFGAKDTLTRAQAAKIVAYLDMGKDVADALVGTGKVFSDVKANNWAAGYIEYLYQAGIVAGIGDGKFGPDEKVTGLQFAKMLLVVLGYDQKIEELTGASWEINVAKLAASNDLFKAMSGKTNVALTREQAAQVAFNALKATTVDYDTKGTNITIGDANIAVGASKAVAVKAKTDGTETGNYAGDVATADGYGTIQLLEKLYGTDLKKLGTSETNDFGAPYSHYWTMKGVAGKVAKTAKDASITITKAYDKTESDDVKEVKDLLSAAGVTIKSSDNTFTKTDGTAAPVATTKNYLNGTGSQGAVASVEALMDLTGNGKKVELFINSDKVITDIVATSYSVATVSDITETTKTSSGSVYTTYTVKDKNTNSEYSGKVYTKAAKDESNTATIYSGIAEDDVVTYVVAGSKLYVYPTTKVVGQQTAIKGSTITVSGTKYTLAAVTAGTFDNVDKDFAYYIDQYGYAVYTEAVSTTSYAVVLDIAKISGVDGKVEAKLLFVDGSAKIVNVDKAYKKDGSSTPDLEVSADVDAYKNQFVTYTIDDDGLYTLKQVDEDTKITGSTSTAIAPAYKKGTPQNIGGKTLDNKTIVLVAYKSSGKTVYGAYTGYAAMPTIYGAAVNGDYVIKSDALKYVFLNAAIDGVTVADEADTSTYIYVLSDDVTVTGVGSKKVYTVEVAKDGAATTIGMKQDAYDAVFATAATKDKGLYKVTTVDKDGNVTAVAVAEGDGTITKASVTAVGSGVINGSLTYDDDTTFVFIDVDGSVRTGSGDSIKTATTASIFYKLKSGSAVKLDTVYVILKNAE